MTRFADDSGKALKLVWRGHVPSFKNSKMLTRGSTILDCMVKAGAIPDDNRFEVGRLEAEAVDCERGRERVEVEIIGQ